MNLTKKFPHSYRKLIHVKAAYSVYFRCIETFRYARQIKTGSLRSITYTYSKPSINFLNLQLNADHFLVPSTCIFTCHAYKTVCNAKLHFPLPCNIPVGHNSNLKKLAAGGFLCAAKKCFVLNNVTLTCHNTDDSSIKLTSDDKHWPQGALLCHIRMLSLYTE